MENGSLPKSIAIAGAWGYIGRKFLSAALDLGITPYVFDPGPRPADIDERRVRIIDTEREFYELDADVFHLALHPDARRNALTILFARSSDKHGPVILCEKPIAMPDDVEFCAWIASEAERSGASLFFDFPELFDPMTLHIWEFLSRFSGVRFTRVEFVRSKDREDPRNPRNYKLMLPIQYQETIHCIAFLLCMLTIHSGDDFDAVCRAARAEGAAEEYTPPNPEEYPAPVDGRFEGALTLNRTRAVLTTDFSAGSPWRKTKLICGVGDGQPFSIQASFLEGAKYLTINGVDQGFSETSNSYQHVLRQLWRWHKSVPRNELMTGHFPNQRLAQSAYSLSGALWRSCDQRRSAHRELFHEPACRSRD